MSDKDDRIVNFNDIKNKAREKDVEKFEDYVYQLSYDMSQGKLSMGDFYRDIQEYMTKNNISQEKLFNIQKELMKRYGFNMEDVENQMKSMGIEIPHVEKNSDYETLRKKLSFQEKYKDGIGSSIMTTYDIKNSLNDLTAFISDDKVILKSQKEINLQDSELNEFLCSYKKVVKDKKLQISLCENVGTFEY
ncbi:DUF3867 domain-containing protein [Clostridium luticellarii]|uniref:DUF3867 domain-containing protein n=1 Tax=Clostridium luticellarii TaxID=1691940 RepID=A0A2T0BS38_9CLOT|nr:DUF3867 domain-containing protein [Clostridium luticellarii]MCI1943654.1 DUF3867 domain-containing protein [Clostridium luticellarii]MCI1969621.1 DUF3867 domain-containing protein [Clostridium luticellarii]MCI1996597.1 DUF3867 domain-containing protein [Clostridium luticellarii]MCI2038765.1 DUF3867 domain-containing protein [Clostridium luticellarii]PRR86642.1 hypothetical protein CLLU_04430 [Clostridium luticellarii]